MASKTPRLFIASTVSDLRPFRERATIEAGKAGFLVVKQEFFSATENPPLDECLSRVGECDLLLVLVAHRYGWIPKGQKEDPGKSITWLECEEALRQGRGVLAFLLAEDAEGKKEDYEEFAIMEAVRNKSATPKLLAEVQSRVDALGQFKQWLTLRTTCIFFKTPDDLGTAVLHALQHWSSTRPGRVARPKGPAARGAAAADPSLYVQAIRAENEYIDIRGLATGEGKVHRFPIVDLYIPLTTHSAPEDPSTAKDKMERAAVRAPVSLESIVGKGNIVILGDPGSGKSTLLRRAAFELADRILHPAADSSITFGAFKAGAVPILVDLGKLARFIAERRNETSIRKPVMPVTRDSPEWLFQFLDGQAGERGWRFASTDFKRVLTAGAGVLLLDGLDEAPDRKERENLAKIVEHLARDYPKAAMVVTSRPVSYSGKSMLGQFAHGQIEPLADGSVRNFVAHWSNAVHRNDRIAAARLKTELLSSVTGKAEIRRMARNPVMLTALAVLQWNNKRLPERRAELYESIVTWLSRSREQRSGRLPAERCVVILQELALAMQRGLSTRAGRKRAVQVPRRWAAEQIRSEREFAKGKVADRVREAEQFLREEEVDSGIVVTRGEEIRFWHLTFQEFLAARAMSGMAEKDQTALLLGKEECLYRPEWREVVLLFAGLLIGQGPQKVDWLVGKTIGALKKPSLAAKARCAGILGAIARDLTPATFEISDPRYSRLLYDVIAIFESKRSESIPIPTRIEAAEALGQAGDPRLDPKHPDRWVGIPAGRFLMGAQKENPQGWNFDAEANDPESPVHEVSLGSFEMSRFPVTVQEYAAFIDDDGYQNPLWWKEVFGRFSEPDGWQDQLERPNSPVVSVSWFEASAFAEWCGCRLPTEAQWERAARGSDGRKYPWGDEPDPSRLNSYESMIQRPTPVGIYPSGGTPYGIYDLAGNVWEWCEDWYDFYSEDAAQNPTGPPKGDGRVLRGGSWGSDVWFARSACRYAVFPDDRESSVGFRLVRRRQDS